MKKFNKIFLAAIFFFIPIIANAAASVEPDYEVVASYISGELDFVGSVHIKEAIVVKGDLNGYRLALKYKNSRLAAWEPGKIDFANSSIYNARSIDIYKISAMPIDKEDIGWGLLNLDFKEFEENSSANKGDMGIFTKTAMSDGVEIKTYNVNRDGYMVFYFDYFLNQIAVLHEDCAEVYYTFFTLDEDDVDEVKIQITTPGYSRDDTFRVWAHGALNGNINPVSDKKDEEGNILYKGALAEVKNFKAGDLIEIRMTFDKNLISTAFGNNIDTSKMEALKSIEEIEQKRADEANKKRKFIKVVYNTTLVGAIGYLIGLIVIWVFMYIKYDKEHKVNFDMHYYREFTGDYNVEVVDYLLKENISTNAMNASIMNLIYKKNIDIEEVPDSKKDLVLIEKSRDKLNSTELILMEMLFDTIGKEGRVTLKEIEKFSSKYSTAEKFMSKYNAWVLSATADAKKENFFESLTLPRACASLYFVLGIVIFFLCLGFNIEPIILPIAVLILSIIFLVYVWAFKKWSKKGREHYLKWQAFKNFLLNFGKLDEKEIPEIKLWDKYLVYATVLGVAKEVQKSMKVRLTNMGMNESVIGPRTFYMRDFYIMNSISNSMSNARTKSMNVISAENAKSNMSGGGGFGGGFSGGGGFAGGGGGGGGF